LPIPATARGRGERKMEKCRVKEYVPVIYKDWSKSVNFGSLDLKTGNGHVVDISITKMKHWNRKECYLSALVLLGWWLPVLDVSITLCMTELSLCFARLLNTNGNNKIV
jgi:hypothetical protein